MAQVVLFPYTTEWPLSFDDARRELLAAFAPEPVRIEHIGSTAVPGLTAKPVLDILLGAASLSMIEAGIDALARLDYDYIAKHERDIPLRRYFVRAATGAMRIHLHAVEQGGRIWREHLHFRDALRADPQLRNRYQALKLDLATRFADDKAAYTAAKAPFIQSVLATASS